MIEIINDDCRNVIKNIDKSKSIIVTDPPFNIGYHYGTYADNLPEQEYYDMLREILVDVPSAVIHYPESLYKIAIALNEAPQKVVTWCYNSNTAKQYRDIAFFKIKPDFTKVKQPYKNPNDKRIKERIAKGCMGGRLYDWWNINQVKNVSSVKTKHPCQMPLQVMLNIIGILPKGYTIVDPFCGSGTTGVACKILKRDFIGIEIDKEYYEISKNRIEETEIDEKQLELFEI